MWSHVKTVVCSESRDKMDVSKTSIGPVRIGWDLQNSDQLNNKIPAKSRHMKSLGHQLRLLPTFVGVLREKVRKRVSFN